MTRSESPSILPLHSSSAGPSRSPSPRNHRHRPTLSHDGSSNPLSSPRSRLSEDPITAVNTPQDANHPNMNSILYHDGADTGDRRHMPISDSSSSLLSETITINEVNEAEEIAMRAEISRTEEKHINLDPEGSGRGVKEKVMMIDVGHGKQETIIVDWPPGDPENPMNWSNRTKWVMTCGATLMSAFTAVNVTSVAPISNWGTTWFGVSREAFEVTLTVMMTAIAFTPMVLAPYSEVFGRNTIYRWSAVLTGVLFIPQSLSHNFAGQLVVRFLQGMAASVGNSLVVGTVADLFAADQRGMAMNVFAISIFVGQSGGAAVFGIVGERLGYQWCYGIQGLMWIISITINFTVLKETRSDVLLSQRAKILTEKTGKPHACISDLERSSVRVLISVSLVRPFQYLLFEPIVTCMSLWCGFCWACIFLGGTSVQLVFKDYGWTPGQAGAIQTSVFIGGFLGFLGNFHQDWLYARSAKKHGGIAPPEARLYWGAIGGLLFPIGLYGFAWTGRPEIYWLAPAFFFTLSNMGIFLVYSGVYNYFADAYEIYSSSAQASQSFVRNFLSGIFPLFATQLYNSLGYPQASTLVASIALVLQAAPILLLFYGHKLRAKSKVASALAKDNQENMTDSSASASTSAPVSQ